MKMKTMEITGREDYSTSDSDDFSGEEDEEDEFDRIQEINASEAMEGLILPGNHILAKKRTIKCRDPTKKRYKRVKKSTALNSKKPKDRVLEFPNKGLIVNNGEIFCKLCDKQLLTKRSILVQHLRSKKHVVNKINCY